MGLLDFCKSFGSFAKESIKLSSELCEELENNLNRCSKEIQQQIAIQKILKPWNDNFIQEKGICKCYLAWARKYTIFKKMADDGKLNGLIESYAQFQQLNPSKSNLDANPFKHPQLELKDFLTGYQFDFSCNESILYSCPKCEDANIANSVADQYADLMNIRLRFFKEFHSNIIHRVNIREISIESLEILKAKFILENILYLWNELKIDHLIDKANVDMMVCRYIRTRMTSPVHK